MIINCNWPHLQNEEPEEHHHSTYRYLFTVISFLSCLLGIKHCDLQYKQQRFKTVHLFPLLIIHSPPHCP